MKLDFTSASGRTLPMFPGIPPAPPKPPRRTARTLRRRLWKTALAWYRNETGYEEVLTAARELHEVEG